MAAKLRGISKAAQALMVTPPAITMQIKQLEEAVGIRLLIPDGNAIRLTDTGEMVFKRAERIFSMSRRSNPPRVDGQRTEVWRSNNGISLW
jgi:DNA-binding transcriptional LysR family regulator